MSVSIVILCEDQDHDIFVRRFLDRRGLKTRAIRSRIAPPGRQSGELWVRAEYPAELAAIRRRQNDWLVVVLDADTHETPERRRQLERECRQHRIPPRTPKDPVIVIVPRRNIETWFEYLDHGDVDEITVYRKRSKGRDRRRPADVLYDMCHVKQSLPPNAPKSLVESCDEYAKFKVRG